MEIDIRRYLESETSVTESDDWDFEHLPFGWRIVGLGQPIVTLTDLVHGLYVNSVKITQGMLYLSCNDVCARNDDDIKNLFKRVANTVTRDSAIVCMVCGCKGFRRKIEYGKPCLCKAHYIEYLNFVSEQDE